MIAKSLATTRPVTLALAACCAVALASTAAAALGSMSAPPRPDPGVRMIAYGDGPTTGHRRGGGHRKSAPAKDTSPTVSSSKGMSATDADKEYRKKYGF